MVQLIMEESWEEVCCVLEFCTDVGLPVCFSDMEYETAQPELLQKGLRRPAAYRFFPLRVLFFSGGICLRWGKALWSGLKTPPRRL